MTMWKLFPVCTCRLSRSFPCFLNTVQKWSLSFYYIAIMGTQMDQTFPRRLYETNWKYTTGFYLMKRLTDWVVNRLFYPLVASTFSHWEGFRKMSYHVLFSIMVVQLGRHQAFLWGHWYTLFGLLVTSALGFEATCVLFCLCATDSSDSPLVQHLLTYWWAAWQPSLLVHILVHM